MVQEDSYDNQGNNANAPNKGLIKVLIWIVVISVIIIGGCSMYRSQAGQVKIAEFQSAFQFWVAKGTTYIKDTVSFDQNLYQTKTNPESKEKGLILKSFTVASQIDRIPPNGEAIFIYEVEPKNIEELDISDVKVSLNCTVEEEIKSEFVDGEIILIPDKPTPYYTGAVYQCKFKTNPPQEKEETFNVDGRVIFEFETKDATLKTYFTKNKDPKFLSDLGLSKSGGVIYNGEPVMISMALGDSSQTAVFVGDEYNYYTVGVTLRNQWDGTLLKVSSLELKLPNGVEINKIQSPTSVACPFGNPTQERSYNVYKAEQSYIERINEVKSYEYVSFSCFVKIDPSILQLDTEAYAQRNIIASSSYTYATRFMTKAITLLPADTYGVSEKDESPIEGTISVPTADTNPDQKMGQKSAS